MLVDPGVLAGVPATTTTRSPGMPRPNPSMAWSTWRNIASVCSTESTRKVSTPQLRRELVLHREIRREGEQRQLAVQPGEPPHRVAGLGERDQRPGVDGTGDVRRGLGDGAAAGARVVLQPRHLDVAGLGGVDDPGHRLHRDDRVLADTGLAGEHERVRAVEHRVGDVGGLGPGRARAVNHRVEHLGRHDHRLGLFAAQLHGPLLHHRHLLQRQLDTEVTARHHEPVESMHDRLEGGHGLRLLDLRDDRDPTPDLVHDLVDELDVVGRAHERQGHQVDAEVQREP